MRIKHAYYEQDPAILTLYKYLCAFAPVKVNFAWGCYWIFLQRSHNVRQNQVISLVTARRNEVDLTFAPPVCDIRSRNSKKCGLFRLISNELSPLRYRF